MSFAKCPKVSFANYASTYEKVTLYVCTKFSLTNINKVLTHLNVVDRLGIPLKNKKNMETKPKTIYMGKLAHVEGHLSMIASSGLRLATPRTSGRGLEGVELFKQPQFLYPCNKSKNNKHHLIQIFFTKNWFKV